ncbi:hypothetical protein ACIP5Y_27350 [Nocardia sp. NPDC088792]|uniref:hypothetical protein n=1 Tax=Nocardia sp. NPDC088792 TaxID=3364332 RepID=UPI0037F31545
MHYSHENARLIDERIPLIMRLAAVPVSFSTGYLTVVVSPESLMCPTGWAGAVTLGNSAIITAPDPAAAEKIRTAGARISIPQFVITERLGTVLDIAEVRGPAALAYTNDKLFRPAPVRASTTKQVPARDPALNELLKSSTAADRDESGALSRIDRFSCRIPTLAEPHRTYLDIHRARSTRHPTQLPIAA